MSEPYIPNLPSGAEKYNPNTFDFVSFADKKYISESSPVLSTNDKTYRTPDGKTYLKHDFTLRDQNDTIVGNDSAYKVFDNALTLIEFINPPFEDSSTKTTKEFNCSYPNTTTEDILNWALNTYNFKNSDNTIHTVDEARTLLFNGSINYYFSEDGTEHQCVHIDENNIWRRGLPILTNTGSIVSLTENTIVKHFQGMLDNVENGDYLFCNSPLLESVCSNTFPSLQSGRYMFAGCPSLKSFTIPNAPKHSDYMFKGCTSLTKLKFESFNPDTFSGIFNNTPNLDTIDFGNTTISKISSIPTQDVVQVYDMTLITEESDKSLLEGMFNKYTNLYNLNITMSPFPFKNANTQMLSISKEGDNITISFKDENKDINISSTSTFVKDISEFFIDSPLHSVSISSELSGLTMAKNAFSSSSFEANSVKNIYDALPVFPQTSYQNHIITFGIDIDPAKFYFKENDFRNLCGNFVQWNGETQSPIYETNVTSVLIEGDLGSNRFENYAPRDEEYEECPKSELPYVGWITESFNEKGCKTYAPAPLPIINENDCKVDVSFSNFRCLYNTYKTHTIDDYTFVEAVLNNALGGDLGSYNGDKDKVYVQIIKPQSPTSPPELPDELDNVYRINYEPQVGDTVVYAGRLSDLEDDAITLNKSTLYHYYIEKSDESVSLEPVEPTSVTDKFYYDLHLMECDPLENYCITINLGTVDSGEGMFVKLTDDVYISSNDGKSLGIVSSLGEEYNWETAPSIDTSGNLFFDGDYITQFGISWLKDSAGNPFHEDINISDLKVVIHIIGNLTTVELTGPDGIGMMLIRYTKRFNPYLFSFGDKVSSVIINRPSREPKIITSVHDVPITKVEDNNVYADYLELNLSLKLPHTLPEDSFFYNAGFIYENFISDDDGFFPVVILKDDKFREKGWKLDLRFNHKEESV